MVVCAASLQAQTVDNQVKIIKNIKTPLAVVFDPATTDGNWATTEAKEMPLPGGINETLRKKIDAERDRKMGLPNNRSNNKTGKPTAPESIEVDPEKNIDGGTGSGTPNDNSIAVGNDGKVINVLNTNVRIYDETGKPIKFWNLDAMLAGNNNLGGIGATALNRVYDPRVMFDPWAKRWMILFMQGTTDKTSFIVVSFSTSEDPTKPWNVYKIPGTPIKDTVWSDYPIVSQTKADLFFTVNLLANGSSWEEGFREAVIWQIDKQRGYNGDTLRKNFFNNLKYQGVSIWSICPVQNEPIPYDYNDNYFVSVRPYSQSNDTVFLHRIVNTQSSGQAYYELRVLKAPIKYGFPPSALQPTAGFKLRTNDARVLSAIRTGDRVQYLQNSHNFETGQAHLMHGIVHKPLDNPQITANLITDDSLEFGYPAIASAGKNPGDPAALISTVFSSKNHYPGTGCVYVNRYGEYSNYQKLKTGNGTINYSFIPADEQRWGDYEGIQRKYNEEGVFYMVGSYGKLGGSMFAYLARVKIRDTNTADPLESVRIFPIPSKDLYVEINLLDGAENTNVYDLYLIDMAGRRAANPQKITLHRGVNLLKVDANNFAPGTYVLEVKRIGDDKPLVAKRIAIQ